MRARSRRETGTKKPLFRRPRASCIRDANPDRPDRDGRPHSTPHQAVAQVAPVFHGLATKPLPWPCMCNLNDAPAHFMR